MARTLGFSFRVGPEVPKPTEWDWTMSWTNVEVGSQGWAAAIDEAIREHDAWGLLCVAPNCDVTLRDALTPGATLDATRAYQVHLLLAEEAH